MKAIFYRKIQTFYYYNYLITKFEPDLQQITLKFKNFTKILSFTK